MERSDPATGSPGLSPAASDQDTPRPDAAKKAVDGTNPRSPRQRQESLETESELSLQDLDSGATIDLNQEMEKEKLRYPGASTWASEEENLFEILFLRQDMPLLPAHWDVDFRGVPMVDTIFQTSEEHPPVVYSQSGKEFQATTALLRLVDLTSAVRAACQSGQRIKAPALIKKAIDRYVNWAAEDGGYRELQYVPNLTVAVIDTPTDEADITDIMERRMRALSSLQREYLRLDRDPKFWSVDDQQAENPGLPLHELLVEKYMTIHCSTPSAASADHVNVSKKGERPEAATPKSLGDPVPDPQYRHHPPVVYGLFILRTSVFLLTVDASKCETAYVSFHVDVNFTDRHQSVWNALTMAIPICLARDELITRICDFGSVPLVEESDPDA